jgi:hypothetical protein
MAVIVARPVEAGFEGEHEIAKMNNRPIDLNPSTGERALCRGGRTVHFSPVACGMPLPAS